MAFDPNTDPLGIALKGRARDARQAQMTNDPSGQQFMSGPLPDPNWDAWFQAVQESAGTDKNGVPRKINMVGGAPDPVGGQQSSQLVGLQNAGNTMIGYNEYQADQPVSMNPTSAPVQGLRQAGPKVNVPGVGTGSTATEQELQQRRARLTQAAADPNFLPNVPGAASVKSNYGPFPSS
jgi:hypothetical protein